MAFTNKGLRLIKALEKFSKEKPMFFDTRNIFNKIKFTAANDEQMKAVMEVDSTMCNGYNIMHGGYIASIIDIMCLYANTTRPQGKMSYTSSIYVNFIGPASVGEKIIVETKLVKGGHNSILDSVLYKENGTLVAKGTACFKNGTEEEQRQAETNIYFDVLKNDD